MRIYMHGKENEGFATQKLNLSSIPSADIPMMCRKFLGRGYSKLIKFHRALAYRILNSLKIPKIL